MFRWTFARPRRAHDERLGARSPRRPWRRRAARARDREPLPPTRSATALAPTARAPAGGAPAAAAGRARGRRRHRGDRRAVARRLALLAQLAPAGRTRPELVRLRERRLVPRRHPL